ncbi:Tfp pilus assembly protein FimT/FimU [Xanthomonas campestris]
MVTVAVLAIVLAVAVPAFGTLIRSSRLTSNANEVVAALQLARSEAVRQKFFGSRVSKRQWKYVCNRGGLEPIYHCSG